MHKFFVFTGSPEQQVYIPVLACLLTTLFQKFMTEDDTGIFIANDLQD